MPPAPNPFHDSILIVWEQEASTHLLLEVVDFQGKILFSQKMHTPAGKQEWRWEGKDAQGEKVPNGIYAVTLKDEKGGAVKQVVKVGE